MTNNTMSTDSLASVDDPDNLFTPDRPYISDAMVLYPPSPETEEMNTFEEDEPEEVSTIMQDSDTYLESKDEGTITAQESTGVEIREGTASVMISSDQDYQKVVGLSLKQSAAAVSTGQRAVKIIQTDHYEPDIETQLAYLHSQRSKSTRWVVKFKESSSQTNPTIDGMRCLKEEGPDPRRGEGAL